MIVKLGADAPSICTNLFPDNGMANSYYDSQFHTCSFIIYNYMCCEPPQQGILYKPFVPKLPSDTETTINIESTLLKRNDVESMLIRYWFSVLWLLSFNTVKVHIYSKFVISYLLYIAYSNWSGFASYQWNWARMD